MCGCCSKSIRVTLNNGYRMPAWFDIHGLSIEASEDLPGAKNAVNIGNTKMRAHLKWCKN
jgi:hypothetical protein